MTKTIDAIFDGKVLHPVDPLTLEPNTSVRITIEISAKTGDGDPGSFLATARKLQLDGPADWSTCL
jgi:hypothetical protein